MGWRSGLLLSRLAVILLLGGASPSPAPAAEPGKLDLPVFAVAITDAGGASPESFGYKSPPYLDLSFVLALSASPRYATTITVIQDANGRIEEKTLFQGNLEEGFYRHFEPLALPPGKGEIKVKVIVKTRFFPKKFTGESFYVYRQWEGAYLFGK